MAILFKSDVSWSGAWEEAFRACDPDLELRAWPEVGDPDDIEFALVWQMPHGALKRLPNLKVIFSVGAGFDHLTADPDLPRHLPIVRMVEPGLTNGMSEYVVMSVLHHHRFLIDLLQQQRDTVWQEVAPVPAWHRTVGIMGLGVMGSDAAAKLQPFDFKLVGWSRTAKNLPGVTSFHGPEGLTPFLAQSEILVCLLPATPETEGIINSKTLAALPAGAGVINAARGSHVVEDDLLAALDSGHISGATLDVCRQEPLPPEHRFWRHPRVILTPHVASLTIPETAAREVCDNIRRFRSGEPLKNLVDLDRGY